LDARLGALRAALPGPLPPELLVNDLEPAALSLAPAIAGALDDARSAGAEDATVSGSGPTVLGLFWGEMCEARARAAVTALAGRYADATTAVPVEASFGTPRSA
jgi:4-diphosphocytidyl-2-C-methyl-D-erythritol kinase